MPKSIRRSELCDNLDFLGKLSASRKKYRLASKRILAKCGDDQADLTLRLMAAVVFLKADVGEDTKAEIASLSPVLTNRLKKTFGSWAGAKRVLNAPANIKRLHVLQNSQAAGICASVFLQPLEAKDVDHAFGGAVPGGILGISAEEAKEEGQVADEAPNVAAGGEDQKQRCVPGSTQDGPSVDNVGGTLPAQAAQVD